MKKQTGFVWTCVLSTIFVSVSNCWAAPVDLEPEVDSQLLDDDYLNGDMLVVMLRNGEIAPLKTWPNATVYYKISPDFDDLQVTNIKTAMSAIESVSCVRFRGAPNNWTESYVDIKSKKMGCFSAVGYRAGGPQVLNLQIKSPKCFKVPVIIHELLHSLGFLHQHMAPERDDYITIRWENIKPDTMRWFKKFDISIFLNYGYSYDYDSIMHYGRKGFSANGLDTIVPLESNANIGQRLGLSIKDIGKINAMYNCSSREMDTITEQNLNMTLLMHRRK